jgi:hypothetical protein
MQVVQEPPCGVADDFVERARLLEQMSRSLNDHEPLLALGVDPHFTGIS